MEERTASMEDVDKLKELMYAVREEMRVGFATLTEQNKTTHEKQDRTYVRLNKLEGETIPALERRVDAVEKSAEIGKVKLTAIIGTASILAGWLWDVTKDKLF